MDHRNLYSGPLPSFRLGAASLCLALTAAVIALFAAPGHASSQQTGTLTGAVTVSGSGQPVAGAQIVVVGTGIGTIARNNGRYLLQGVPAGTQEIRVEFVGYRSETSQATIQAGESTVLDFSLRTQAVNLDEIVVTGQAAASRRRELGHSISTIGDDIEQRPVTTMDEVLQGASSGLEVISNSGSVGAGAKMRIRGANSISQSNNPLIYVDGVRIRNEMYRQMKGGPDGVTTVSDPGVASSPLNDINPADIERIEVIKGPAATTLYGTEASSGVIQIFTKSGGGIDTEGTRWSAAMTQGFTRIPPSTFFAPVSDAYIEKFGEESEGMWMVGQDWLQTGHHQDYHLSAQGSTGGVDYYAGGRFKDVSGNLPKEWSEEWAARVNLGYTAFDDVSIRLTNSLTKRHVSWLTNGNEAESFLGNVNYPGDYVNDVHERLLELDFQDYQTHWTSGVTVRYQPASDFEMQATLGYDFLDQDNRAITPFGSWWLPDGERAVQRFRAESRTIDVRTTHRTEIAGIRANTSAGLNVNDEEINEVQGHSTNFSGPHDPTLTSGAVRNVIENSLREVNAGVYVQEQLGFGDRFFVTGGLRIDGNSSFGDDLGLEPYPKLSASYVMSDEGFWPDFLEQTKFRASYGESGKAPGYFDAERVWTPIRAKEGEAGVTPSNRGNPELAPERAREYEAGVELSTFEGRLGIDFTYFDQTTKDALIPVPQDPSLGFGGTELRNVGEVDNWGIELSVNGEPLRTRHVRWEVGLNLSTNHSEVVSLGEGLDDFPVGFWNFLRIREGFPLPSNFITKVANPNEIAQPEYTEQEYLGPAIPTTTYSISTSVDVGDHLTLSGRGEYRGGHYMHSWTAEGISRKGSWVPCFEAAENIAAGNLSEVTALERARCRSNPRSDQWVSDASFFRLREVSALYRVPADFVPAPFSSLDVSLSARNLWLLTDFRGLDPESWNQAGQNNLFRYENNQVPIPQTFLLQLRTSF